MRPDELIPVNRIPDLSRILSKSTIQRWIASGFLEARKIGQRWYTSRAAVEKALQGRTPDEVYGKAGKQ